MLADSTLQLSEDRGKKKEEEEKEKKISSQNPLATATTTTRLLCTTEFSLSWSRDLGTYLRTRFGEGKMPGDFVVSLALKEGSMQPGKN